ncbi:hypothetical protein KHQ81_14885 [Mycoplasmatota bacterium]|nr:hypothetical protein KHQ81_14885 [Mycoplasmatota bacterium]
MEFKTEKLMIRIGAILGAVGIFLVAVINLLWSALKEMSEVKEAFENAGQEMPDIHLTATYFVSTVLSILVVVALFIIANKLNSENSKIMGIALLVLTVASYWLLWFVPIILIAIAGIMVLIKGNK